MLRPPAAAAAAAAAEGGGEFGGSSGRRFEWGAVLLSGWLWHRLRTSTKRRYVQLLGSTARSQRGCLVYYEADPDTGARVPVGVVELVDDSFTARPPGTPNQHITAWIVVGEPVRKANSGFWGGAQVAQLPTEITPGINTRHPFELQVGAFTQDVERHVLLAETEADLNSWLAVLREASGRPDTESPFRSPAQKRRPVGADAGAADGGAADGGAGGAGQAEEAAVAVHAVVELEQLDDSISGRDSVGQAHSATTGFGGFGVLQVRPLDQQLVPPPELTNTSASSASRVTTSVCVLQLSEAGVVLASCSRPAVLRSGPDHGPSSGGAARFRSGWLHCFGTISNSIMLIHPGLELENS